MTHRIHPPSRLLTAATIVLIVTTGAASTARAQTASDCPDGWPAQVQCLTPEPTVCLSAAALDEHESDLKSCRSKLSKAVSQRDDCSGRLSEVRRALEAEQARADQLAGRPTRGRAALWGAGASVVGVAVGVVIGAVAIGR